MRLQIYFTSKALIFLGFLEIYIFKVKSQTVINYMYLCLILQSQIVQRRIQGGVIPQRKH
jgi:hypothetical protein